MKAKEKIDPVGLETPIPKGGRKKKGRGYVFTGSKGKKAALARKKQRPSALDDEGLVRTLTFEDITEEDGSSVGFDRGGNDGDDEVKDHGVAESSPPKGIEEQEVNSAEVVGVDDDADVQAIGAGGVSKKRRLLEEVGSLAQGLQEALIEVGRQTLVAAPSDYFASLNSKPEPLGRSSASGLEVDKEVENVQHFLVHCVHCNE